MTLKLTTLSHGKLATAVRSRGRYSLYLQGPDGRLQLASLRSEVTPTAIVLTLVHRRTTHSISVPTAGRTAPDKRAAEWIEDCANGRDEALTLGPFFISERSLRQWVEEAP